MPLPKLSGAQIACSFERWMSASSSRRKRLTTRPSDCTTVVHLQGRAGEMVWTIVAAVFLGTVFAALCVMLAWSRWSEIRAALKEHRAENRIPVDVFLAVSKVNEAFVEKVSAQNISRHGARVATKTRWQPNERVLVTLPQQLERAGARITYCQCLSEQSFGVGLQFSSAVEERSFGI